MEQGRIAHLGLVQGVIGRMATTSLALKSLAVTLAAAIMAFDGLAPNKGLHSWIFCAGSVTPLVILWMLDTYYLGIEKAYRRLFDQIRLNEPVESFSMDYRPYKQTKRGWLFVFICNPTMWVYPALMVITILAITGAGL